MPPSPPTQQDPNKMSSHQVINQVSAKDAKKHLPGPRLAKVAELFKEKFYYEGYEEPSCIIRAPGRVNLIGDHIDYHGFAVLPMAIENCIWLACFFKPLPAGSSELEMANSNWPAYHPSGLYKHSMGCANLLDKSSKWYNYILCGFYGVTATEVLHVAADDVLEHAKLIANDPDILSSADRKFYLIDDCKLFVDSDLPAASGLSSSSALVCASAVASVLLFQHSNIIERTSLDSIRLAYNCSKYEQLVGTHGGGMDQAVIMTAQKGYAKYVEFRPNLRCENVRLPKETVWLVSHCGVDYPKASTSGFNSRVLETKIAAALIAKSKQSPSIKLDWTITLARIKDELYGEHSLVEMIDDIRRNVFAGRNSFSVSDICSRLELTRDQLAEQFKTSDQFLKEEMNEELQLLNRCEHVLEEADRVVRFKSICDTTVDIAQLGQLMTQSHYSLRDKFECSHPALDKLVSVALDAGALGSRLTGAGWGGCIVSLVEASKRDIVMERLREVSKFTFETEPSSGCEVYWLVDRKTNFEDVAINFDHRPLLMDWQTEQKNMDRFMAKHNLRYGQKVSTFEKCTRPNCCGNYGPPQ